MSELRFNPNIRRSACIYFLVQGLSIFGWWAIMMIWPQTRQYFILEPKSEASLLSFWLSDLTLLGPGSIVTSWLFFKDSEYASIAAWFVSGVVGTSVFYCLAFAFFTDIGWLGITLMFPAMIFFGIFAVGATFRRTMFRAARESSVDWIVIKTLTQIVVVWSIILIIFPYFITIVERRIGIAKLEFAYQRPIAAVLFIAISSIGVLAAISMSREGLGTPLPLDHATRLVVRGPYAYVRNPMALSGIGQGLAVALFLGSPLVAVYAFMGAFIWQLVFRPLEEADLRHRFGADYEAYCREVKCWIPRNTAYQMDGAVDSSNCSISPLGRM